MNIRAKINQLIDLQDNITRLNENKRDVGALRAQRTSVCNQVVEYVTVLEQRVELLEAAIVEHVRRQKGRIEPLEANHD